MDDIFNHPTHPYTLGLLKSMPRLDETGVSELPTIPGQPPNLQNLPTGCAFRARCGFAQELCASELPPLRPITHDRAKSCLRDDIAELAV